MSNMLSTGVSGLTAAQVALSTVSNNISNANTDGYNRQVVHQVEAVPPGVPGFTVGRGVDVVAVSRAYSDFLTSALWNSNTGLQRATTKWDLRPNLLVLNDALGVLSSGQRMFLSAMVSFYNAREGGAMLKRCGFEGLSDLAGLDLERRKVIADLTLHYSGW